MHIYASIIFHQIKDFSQFVSPDYTAIYQRISRRSHRTTGIQHSLIRWTLYLSGTCTFLKPDVLAASAWSGAPGLMSHWTVANTEGEKQAGAMLRKIERKVRHRLRESDEGPTVLMHSSTAWVYSSMASSSFPFSSSSKAWVTRKWARSRSTCCRDFSGSIFCAWAGVKAKVRIQMWNFVRVPGWLNSKRGMFSHLPDREIFFH